MKLGEIFRFELVYQLRRRSTWLYVAAVAVAAFLMVTANYVHEARRGEYFVNGPFVITLATFFASLAWLLVAAAVAGDAAARDVHTRMHSLTYTSPVSKAAYLGGRFLAAFAVNALILLAAPAGILLGVHLSGAEAELVGPFRPAAYAAAYGVVALPNAFFVTAIQFSFAALNGRVQASYLASFLLFAAAYIVGPVAYIIDRELGHLVDPIGVVGILSELPERWTVLEKNTRLVRLEGALLANRLLWTGVGLAALAVAHGRFRFAHPAEGAPRGRAARREPRAPAGAGARPAPGTAVAVPRVARSFGVATRARQTLAIAAAGFRQTVQSRSGLVLLGVLALLMALTVPRGLVHLGVPLLPRTDHVVRILTAPLNDLSTPWVFFPLLTVFYAGELVWRERDAGVSDIADAAPVPEGVLFLGKFLALALVLATLLALLMAAGMVVQALAGGDVQPGLYLRALFGLQFVDYLLFAVLAMVVHVVVDHKSLGHLVAFTAYGLIAFASQLGIEHNLLVYGSGPAWSYTEMRGWGSSVAPWAWFKLYWAAWALLLGVVASRFWVRSREGGPRARLALARRRFTRPAGVAAGAAAGLVLATGGFIFHNTNVLNEYHSSGARLAARAEYERRYGRFAGVPQPRLSATTLEVEIHPRRGEVDIRGAYRLVNGGRVPIDTLHLATMADVETGPVGFDRPAVRVLADEALGHRVYALKAPLQPGDSLRLTFGVRFAQRGFRNDGADDAVAANGTYFQNTDWLPAVGYQAARELSDPADRRAHGLAPRPAVPPLHAGAGRAGAAAERTLVEAVVGTDADQRAVGPGALQRTWTRGGRRYGRYATDVPIRNDYAFFSARYAVHRARWNDVDIEVWHDPRHGANAERMVQGARASLAYHARRFGPYPHDVLRFVEHPGRGYTLHAAPVNVAFEEGFSRFHPDGDPRAPDLVFSVAAHEVAHQWWGGQLTPARVEGAPVLSESLAQYAAMRVVEEAGGAEPLRRLLRFMREPHVPPVRAGPPLLRATDEYRAYRTGPFALYALSEYVGRQRVDAALRRLLQAHGPGRTPATTLDLYRELRAVTPASVRPLLHDLFQANTVWDLRTERATARRTDEGGWQVTLKVRTGKVVVDSAGGETPVPMDDWVQVTVFAAAESGTAPGALLYSRVHRIRSDGATITVTVPRRPARAGIDTGHLLTDLEMGDNIREIEIVR